MSDKASLADRVAAAEETNQKLSIEVDHLQDSATELAAIGAGLRDELDDAARLIEKMAKLYRKSRGYSADEQAACAMRKSAEMGRPFSISTWVMKTPEGEGGAE